MPTLQRLYLDRQNTYTCTHTPELRHRWTGVGVGTGDGLVVSSNPPASQPARIRQSNNQTAPPRSGPRVLTKQMLTDGQQTKTNPKTSPEQSVIFQLVQEINKTNCVITRKTAPPPWQPYNYKTNLFNKFHDDWAKNVTSRVKLPPGSHVIQLTGTIFQLNSCIQKTNVLIKFHENWAKNVTSRVFTYKKNALPTAGNVFSPIWAIFKLVRHINKTNVLINFHDDWAKIVTSRVFTRNNCSAHWRPYWALNVTSTVFELNQDIIGTNLLTKFHKDPTIYVVSRVFTNKCLRTYDGQRPVTKAHLSNQLKTRATDRRTERKLPRPPGNHVFQQTGTIFKLNSRI
ncbi:hypothetical protein DPMN_019281 [Dreissena polymorpha]|uniref:Uncharacterized protein n=1 Tax=Dreissena polymorpha TaxID=45954 RepID=A0A9D4NIZ2_DREPO|nr:hypothetical protein DPMN_019281 [Dreissena polymorpha]